MSNIHFVYGLGTFVVLFISWAAACTPFILFDTFKLCQSRLCQPPTQAGTSIMTKNETDQSNPPRGKRSAYYSSALRKKALNMVVFNWILLLGVVFFAAPAIAILFPRESMAEWSPSSTVAAGLLWFLAHDLWFYAFHRTLHKVPILYARVHKAHHAFVAPFSWSSHAVHPIEVHLVFPPFPKTHDQTHSACLNLCT